MHWFLDFHFIIEKTEVQGRGVSRGKSRICTRPLTLSPHASRSFMACQWIQGVLPWARCEPLQEKALAYGGLVRENSVEEAGGKSEATASCDVSCGEKTELSAVAV